MGRFAFRVSVTALSPLFLAVLAGCATREMIPSELEMDRVEAALKADSCVGDLVDWQRRYYFHAKYFGDEVAKAAKEQRAPRASGHVRSVIGFDLKQSSAALPLVEAEDREASQVQPESGAPSEVIVLERRGLASPPFGEDASAKDIRRATGRFDLRTGKLVMARCDAKSGSVD